MRDQCRGGSAPPCEHPCRATHAQGIARSKEVIYEQNLKGSGAVASKGKVSWQLPSEGSRRNTRPAVHLWWAGELLMSGQSELAGHASDDGGLGRDAEAEGACCIACRRVLPPQDVERVPCPGCAFDLARSSAGGREDRR
jgi:hypothetical protein